MQTMFVLVAVLFVLGVRSSKIELNKFTTCDRDYKKQGCFYEAHTEMELIISDRDSSGIELNWKKFNQSVHSLACRCSEKARNNGYTYFSIRYYAECWAGKKLKQMEELLSEGSQKSDNCITHAFQTCQKGDERECVGEANNEFFYSLPINGGYSQWNGWGSCNATCGGGYSERRRTCTKPIPSRGGKGCDGPSFNVKKCYIKKCEGPKPTVPIVVPTPEKMCNGRKPSLSCRPGYQIKIRGISYGGSVHSICQKYGYTGITHCSRRNSFISVRRMCNNRRSCVLEDKLSDPCYGKYKYLSVRFSCDRVPYLRLRSV